MYKLALFKSVHILNKLLITFLLQSPLRSAANLTDSPKQLVLQTDVVETNINLSQPPKAHTVRSKRNQTDPRYFTKTRGNCKLEYNFVSCKSVYLRIDSFD